MNDDITSTEWQDTDDGPEWTETMFDRAEYRVGGKLIRAATGTMTRDYTVEEFEARKQSEEVVLRLDLPVLEYFREGGPDWRARINAALLKVVEAA